MHGPRAAAPRALHDANFSPCCTTLPIHFTRSSQADHTHSPRTRSRPTCRRRPPRSAPGLFPARNAQSSSSLPTPPKSYRTRCAPRPHQLARQPRFLEKAETDGAADARALPGGRAAGIILTTARLEPPPHSPAATPRARAPHAHQPRRSCRSWCRRCCHRKRCARSAS
jgi:hypothetical protein